MKERRRRADAQPWVAAMARPSLANPQRPSPWRVLHINLGLEFLLKGVWPERALYCLTQVDALPIGSVRLCRQGGIRPQRVRHAFSLGHQDTWLGIQH